MGAVGRGKGIVDIALAQLGKLFSELGIVLFLADVKPQVFKQDHLAGREVADYLLHLVSHAVGRHVYARSQKFRETARHGQQAHGLDHPALGTAQVGHENDLSPLVNGILNGGQGLPYPGIVGDGALFVEGNVEIHAYENLFRFQVQFLDGPNTHSMCPPYPGMFRMWNAVRLKKESSRRQRMFALKIQPLYKQPRFLLNK